MPCQVTHRPDGFLQTKNAEQRDPDDPSIDRHVKNVMWPTWLALEMFVDDRLIGYTFDNEEQLRDLLVEWPTFYWEIHAEDPNPNWGRLELVGDQIVVDARGGSKFIVAHVLSI